jgi:hypothetical protein
MNWSQDYVSMVKHICDTFDSANISFSDYEQLPENLSRKGFVPIRG